MSLNYEYIVEFARRMVPATDGRVLDYGCGAGQVVARALRAGLDCYGVDVFYEGGSYRSEADHAGLLGDRIFELQDGRIPMEDEVFDLVVANQVFEHIDDFARPLEEIHRVLKPGGIFLSLFPSRLVWREGHVGIPFVHWFPKGSDDLRYRYTLTLRRLGMGHHHAEKSAETWTRDALAWIDAWTHYKPLRAIEQAFAGRFDVRRIEKDWLGYRIRRHPRLSRVAPLLCARPLDELRTFVASRLAGHVFLLEKRHHRG